MVGRGVARASRRGRTCLHGCSGDRFAVLGRVRRTGIAAQCRTASRQVDHGFGAACRRIGLRTSGRRRHVDWLRWAFRAERLHDAQRHYEEYVRDPAGLTWSFDKAPTLGTRRFKAAVAEFLSRGRENRPISLGCRRWARPPLKELFVSAETDTRRRDALILGAHVTHGYRLAEIARFLAVEPSTVSKAASRARVHADVKV